MPDGAWRSRGVLQGGDVALGQAELAGLEQAAHDLAAARVRQVLRRTSISLGATAAPSRLRAKAEQLAAQLVARLVAVLQRDERLDHLAGHRVGLADHAGLGDGRVLHQRALDLERADQVAGGLDHVVGAADEPEVAVGVAPGEVAGEVPAAGEAVAVALRRRAVAAEHRRPARPQRELALDARLGRPDVRRRRALGRPRRGPAPRPRCPGSGRPIEPGRMSHRRGSWRS